jgi:putative transposase
VQNRVLALPVPVTLPRPWRRRSSAGQERLGIRQSVGRTGICFDNALAESFNAAVKVERVHRTVYPTRQKARKDIARTSQH